MRLSTRHLTEEQVVKDIENLDYKHNKKVQKIFNKKYNCTVEKYEIENMKVLEFLPKCKELKKDRIFFDSAIMYFDGAGYVRPPRRQHIKFIF